MEKQESGDQNKESEKLKEKVDEDGTGIVLVHSKIPFCRVVNSANGFVALLLHSIETFNLKSLIPLGMSLGICGKFSLDKTEQSLRMG